MERRKILFDEKEYEYKLYYKNIKSLYIRFVNGEIIVSAPFYTDLSVIESFLLMNKEKLLDRIENYVPYIGEDYVYLFGERCSLVIVSSKRNECIIKNHSLYVYSLNYKTTLEKYLLELLYSYISQRVDYYIERYHIPRPLINIKYYKSKWGCCYIYKNKVVYNKVLVHLDKKLIDYVIVHELCHFKEKGHNQRLYSLIEESIPDYKECIEKLKGCHT